MLARFGFTPTETRVYQALLSAGPSTGYAIAHQLGIARANVYQAMESLVRRGAARKAATVPAQYTATGPAALVAELERSFRRDLGELEESLQALPIAVASSSTALEHLTTASQLLARAASCVDSAQRELLALSGPWGAAMHDRFVMALGRRVAVRALALEGPVPDGIAVRESPPGLVTAEWGGRPLGVVADRQRAVFGVLLDGDRASGVATSAPGAVPFLHRLLRHEIEAG